MDKTPTEEIKEIKTLEEILPTGAKPIGNEAYLMINDKFIKPNELTSGLEAKGSSNTNPIDPEYAKCIQDFIESKLGISGLTFENSAHSEQRMLYYIYKNYIELIETGKVKFVGKKSITIFTGRICCKTCSAIIKEFAKKYEKYVYIRIIDFWEVRKDSKENCNNCKFINAFDNTLEGKDKEVIEKFKTEIDNNNRGIIEKEYFDNKDRKWKTGYQVANNDYTIESLKGDSNNPTLMEIEDLIKEKEELIEFYTLFLLKNNRTPEQQEQLEKYREKVITTIDKKITRLEELKSFKDEGKRSKESKEIQEQIDKLKRNKKYFSKKKNKEIKLLADNLEELEKEKEELDDLKAKEDELKRKVELYKESIDKLKEIEKELNKQKQEFETLTQSSSKKGIVSSMSGIVTTYRLIINDYKKIKKQLETAKKELDDLIKTRQINYNNVKSNLEGVGNTNVISFGLTSKQDILQLEQDKQKELDTLGKAIKEMDELLGIKESEIMY